MVAKAGPIGSTVTMAATSGRRPASSQPAGPEAEWVTTMAGPRFPVVGYPPVCIRPASGGLADKILGLSVGFGGGDQRDGVSEVPGQRLTAGGGGAVPGVERPQTGPPPGV